MVGERGQFHVRASKGIHLVVPQGPDPLHTGLILRTEKSVLFVIPWGRHWIIGTTDTDWDLDKAHPAASSADIDYLLEHVNSVLAVPLTRDDVEGVYAGLRPLLAGESDADQQAVARAHRRASGARPRGRGRRQVHDVPGDGQGRGRRGGARPRPAGRRLRHRGRAAGRRRGLPARCGTRERGSRPGTGLHVGAGGAPAEPVRLAGRGGARPRRRRPRRSASRCRAPTTTCGPRSSTPPRTRAPGTWTTC